MKVQFLKWGNSLALRVPKVFAQEIGASVGKPASMEVRDGKLVVELAKPRRRRRRYTLEQLVPLHSDYDFFGLGLAEGSGLWVGVAHFGASFVGCEHPFDASA